MATLIKTCNGTSAGPSNSYKFYVRARLYKDSDTGSGYKMHWVWDTYFIRWDNFGTTFTLNYGGTTTTPHMSGDNDYTNVSWQSKTGSTFTVNYGSSCSTSASAKYTGESGTTYTSTLASSSTTYTVPLPTYTISYNANGGTGAPTSQSKTYGTNITLSSVIPTKSSYDFQGWATSSTATEPDPTYAPGSVYSTNASLTLFAVWAPSQSNSKITSFTINRCLSDGTDNDQGDYCKITVGYLADTSLWELTNNQISRLKVIIGDIETQTETINAASGTISIKSNNIISRELDYKIIVSIVDTYMDQNNEDFLKYSDQKIKILYGSKSLFRPKMYLKTWLKLDPALNRNDSILFFPDTFEDGLENEKLYGTVSASELTDDYILTITSNTISATSTNDYNEDTVYANQNKDFKIYTYSAGDWNENDNPPEGYLSAHFMNITHSMFKNMFFTVPDKYVINKLHRLCTQESGLVTNNVTNFVNENNKTVTQWNLNANYRVQEWPDGDTDPYNQTHYLLNLDEEEISNEEET